MRRPAMTGERLPELQSREAETSRGEPLLNTVNRAIALDCGFIVNSGDHYYSTCCTYFLILKNNKSL